MKKILYTLCSSVLLLNAAVAQQLPLSSHYHINPMMYNPAMAGTGSTGNFFLIHRSQWDGVTNAPQINTLTFDMPVIYNKLGIGVNINSNNVGLIRRTSANFSVSYYLGKDFYLGAALGAVNNRVTFSDAKVATQTDQVFSNNPDDNKTGLDGNVGLKYAPGKLEIGVSVPQIFANKFEYSNSGDKTSTLSLSRHYIGTVKYTFDLNKEKGITLYPIVMVRATQDLPTQFEGNLVANWSKAGWIGVGYRSDDAYYVNLGLRFKSISVGYAYEMPAGDDVRKLLGNTNEILLSYSFDARPKKDLQAGQDSLARAVSQLIENAKTDSLNLVETNKRIDKIEAVVVKVDTLEKRVDRLTYEFEKAKEAMANQNNIGDRYNLKAFRFKTNSFKFDAESEAVLQELAQFMKDSPTMKIALYGHADDRGTDEANQILSEKRAKAVYNYLAKLGVDKSRMSYKGYGESKPLVDGTSDFARAKNRCAEFVIIAK